MVASEKEEEEEKGRGLLMLLKCRPRRTTVKSATDLLNQTRQGERMNYVPCMKKNKIYGKEVTKDRVYTAFTVLVFSLNIVYKSKVGGAQGDKQILPLKCDYSIILNSAGSRIMLN